VRIVELVRVANAFMWHQLEICSAKGMARAGGEVCERHLVGAAGLRLYMVNLAREAVRRKPFGHRVWIEKCAIDSLGRCTEHAVKSDGACGHDGSVAIGASLVNRRCFDTLPAALRQVSGDSSSGGRVRSCRGTSAARR